jgi:hypothetical protein
MAKTKRGKREFVINFTINFMTMSLYDLKGRLLRSGVSFPLSLVAHISGGTFPMSLENLEAACVFVLR